MSPLNDVVDLQTALAIALASVPALLTVLWSLWQHNKRVDDARELLRAEIKGSSSEVLIAVEAVKQRFEVVSTRLSGIEADMKRALTGLDTLDTHTIEVAKTIAEHNVKLEMLFKGGHDQKSNHKDLKKDVAAIQKEVSEIGGIVESVIEPFASRLDDIEKRHIEALNDIIKRALDKYGKKDD